MTLDGKVAQASRLPATFGSHKDRRRLLELRARADAILVGAHTAKTDHYAMGLPTRSLCQARLRHGQAKYPLRCVVTGRGSIEEDIEIFRHDFSPILIFTTRRMSESKRKRLEKKAQVIFVGRQQINWRKLLGILRGQFDVKKLLVEGGPTLQFALLKQNLLDELYLTICPKIFGGRDAPTLVEGEGLPLRAARIARWIIMEQIADELFLRCRIEKNSSSSRSLTV